MKKMFMKMLNILEGCGEISEAIMYSSGTYSSITIENENGKYEIAIIKKEEGNKNA